MSFNTILITLVAIHSIVRLVVIRVLWPARGKPGAFFVMQDQSFAVSYDLFLLSALAYVLLDGAVPQYAPLLAIFFLGFYGFAVLGTLLFALYLRGIVSESTPRKIVQWIRGKLY